LIVISSKFQIYFCVINDWVKFIIIADILPLSNYDYKCIIALSEQECELWLKGLYHLVNDTVCAPYPLQVERWLRKEFYIMENSRETLV
jgi:hypothetical protein